MSLRPLCLSLALAVLTALAGTGPAQTKKPAGTSKAVYYKTKGSATWSLFGHYASEGSVKDVVAHLKRSGHEVEVRDTDRPVPKPPPRPPSGLLPALETVSYARCAEAFTWMASQSDIAFRFPLDGCYARAHLMCERLAKKGFKPRKLWSVANGESLHARTKNHPNGYVKWAYHVAPVLRIRRADGSQRWYVIDPSLFTRPATVTQWEKAQMQSLDSPRPYLTIARVGQAPLWIDHKRKPGTGYWPGSDPKGGPTAHALATMRKYKPWEGKVPPKGVVWLHRPGHESEWTTYGEATMGYSTDFTGRFLCYHAETKEIAAFLQPICDGDHAALAALADWLTDHDDARGRQLARLAAKPPKTPAPVLKLFPMKPEHVAYLQAFNHTRRMKRDARKAARLPDPVREAVGLPVGREGAYFVGAQGFMGQDHDASVVDYNTPPWGQPGLWCQWTPTDEGTAILWNGAEKFYYYDRWLKFLIGHFLKPWGCVLNGEVKWQGEDPNDRGTLIVSANDLRVEHRYGE